MKNVKESIGIDVSKKTIDVYRYNADLHKQFSNDSSGFKKMLVWVKASKNENEEFLFCFEHTGWYCIQLSYYLCENGLRYCCVNPMEIKRSMGLKRGKSDQADSKEIARYAWLRREELECSVPPSKNLIELQRMMSLREQLVKHSTSLKCLDKGMQVLVEKGQGDIALEIVEETLLMLGAQIVAIEKAMNQLVKQDESMYLHYKLSRSVKGVGMVLALQMLLHTHNYTRFASWRQFSSYCGLVPFPYQSGTSIHGRMKIHPISDRKMKSLLSMSAISAIQHDKQLKLYYHKRVEEGKPKMVVLNIIRNKIVSRIFATINRGTPYVEMEDLAA
jgi:transposase